MFAIRFAWLVGCWEGGRRVVLKAHMLHVIAVVSSYTDTDTFFCFIFSILKCLL